MTTPSRPTQLLLLGVRAYRRLFAGRPSPCRFSPTCSAYAEEALLAHGAAQGAWLAARRIGRCRPGGGSGFDPIPERWSMGGAADRPVPTPGAPVPGHQPEFSSQHPRRVS